MHIEWTPETLAIQLGYPANDAMQAQAKRIMDSAPGFAHFAHHLLSLKDAIAPLEGYLAFSSSRDAIKIKTDATTPETIEAYTAALERWSAKYKVALEPVQNTHTFYIIGQR